MDSATTPERGRPRVAFAMEQSAGHVTNYANLRNVVDADGRLDPRWIEVGYHRDGGRIERFAHAARVVPGYISGVSRAVVEMRRGLAPGDADAIFTNAAVSPFFVRRFRATPTLLEFDSTPKLIDSMPEYTPTPDPAPVARLKFRLWQRVFASVAWLQAWSRWAARSAIDDYGADPARVSINPPGIDLERWRPVDRTPPAVGSPTRVLFVGGDFVRKGGDDLLGWKAASGRDDIEIDVVTREQVSVRPGVRVHHDLEPNSPALLDLYRRAHVFVLPSRGECFGIASIEAMATGLPVVQSTVGGAADIVDDGESGSLVPPSDPAAIGAAIESIVDDPTRWVSMSIRARQLAEERFDVRTNASVTVNRLLALAGGTDGPGAGDPD